LRLDLSLPAAVLGPVLRWALARLKLRILALKQGRVFDQAFEILRELDSHCFKVGFVDSVVHLPFPFLQLMRRGKPERLAKNDRRGRSVDFRNAFLVLALRASHKMNL
jgi:hypothetical protein